MLSALPITSDDAGLVPDTRIEFPNLVLASYRTKAKRP